MSEIVEQLTGPQLIAMEIASRIHALESLSIENLKGEMQQLKASLIENPAACLLLKEEDIGAMVASLRKITGQAIVSAASKKSASVKKPAAGSKKLTAAELAAALDDEDF